MILISADIVATYAPRGSLSQKDLIEIGKSLPMNFLAKCIRIILETFSFFSFINHILNGYFANFAVEEITKYNLRFAKDNFIPTEEMLASIKGYLDTHSTSILNFNTALYKKIDVICRAHDLIGGVLEEDNFLIKAYDLSTEKERKELMDARIIKIEINKKLKNSVKRAPVKKGHGPSIDKACQPKVLPEEINKSNPENAEDKLEMGNLQFVEIPLDIVLPPMNKKDGFKVALKEKIIPQDELKVKPDVDEIPPKKVSNSDKLLAAFKRDPSAFASSFLLELSKNFLQPEKAEQLETSMKGMSPVINHLALKLLSLAPAPNEIVKKLIDELLDLFGKEQPNLPRQHQLNLVPIIQKIIDNSIDEAFVKSSAEQVKAAILEYPTLNLMLGPLVDKAFSPMVPDLFKTPLIKVAAQKALDYFSEIRPDINDLSEIRKYTGEVVVILTPILDKLDEKYKLVEQYKVADKIANRLKLNPLKEEDAVSFIKPLIKNISIQNLSCFYLPFSSAINSILKNSLD